MRLIAQKEGLPIYLIDLETEDSRAFTYDDSRGIKYAPIDRDAILQRGYWIVVDDNADIVARAVEAPEVPDVEPVKV